MIRCKMLGYMVLVVVTLFMTVDNAKSLEEKDLIELHRHKKDLYALSVIKGERIWAVGNSGVIVHSADGGKNWSLQESSMEKSLFDVFFHNEELGWIVGQDGSILETINGGKDWTVQQKNKTYHLFSLGHTDDYVYAVGNFGTILYKKKTDPEWKDASLGEDIILNDIFFLNNKIGWIGGEFGLLLKTDSGGQSWHKIDVFEDTVREEERPFIYSLHFKNEKEGVITIPGYKVLLTEDGCQSWEMLTRKRSYFSASYANGTWYFAGEGGIETFNVDDKEWQYPEFFEKSGAVGLWLRDGQWEGGKGWFVGKGGTIISKHNNSWEKIHPRH